MRWTRRHSVNSVDPQLDDVGPASAAVGDVALRLLDVFDEDGDAEVGHRTSFAQDVQLPHLLLDLLLRRFARLPQRQAHLAGVQAGELHRVLDADGVAVEEQRLDQREEPAVDAARPRRSCRPGRAWSSP